MTLTITLDPKTEAAIVEKAQLKGVTPEAYVTRLAEADAAFDLPLPHPTKPRPMAEIMRKLKDEGILTGYGDPSIDSPELARQLRERFQRRDHSE